MASTFSTGASFTSPTFTVRFVESERLPLSIAVTVTEYALDDAADPGVSKSGADLNVSSPLSEISNRDASAPLNDQLTVSTASSSVAV